MNFTKAIIIIKKQREERERKEKMAAMAAQSWEVFSS